MIKHPTSGQQPASCRVLLVEDDPYARDVMALLLTRDWRTGVAGEVGRIQDAVKWLSGALAPPVDVVVVDGEHPIADDWIERVGTAAKGKQQLHMLCTLTQATPARVRQAAKSGFHGCVLKSEVGYCLADALVLLTHGYWVMTPRVAEEIERLPVRRAVLTGNTRLATLTETEQQVARLAILFEQSRKDIAHELGLSNEVVRRIISDVYEKIGLRALLAGEQTPHEFFADPALAQRIAGHLEDSRRNGGDGAAQKSTLAFHLLTAADLDCVPAWVA